MGKATVSVTYLPTDVLAAWKFVKGEATETGFAEGITKIVTLPTLQHLTLGCDFNQSLDHAKLDLWPRLQPEHGCSSKFDWQKPLLSNLQHLTIGRDFLKSSSSSQEPFCFPSSLKSLTLGYAFNQKLVNRVSFPSNLHTLTFGHAFNQSLDRVTLPSNLRTLTFGDAFDQKLEWVTWPSHLRTLTFGNGFWAAY
eukprot:Skav220937  [mRNA]  locus=scaffold3184:338608:340627:+ [translate_table: standard]